MINRLFATLIAISLPLNADATHSTFTPAETDQQLIGLVDFLQSDVVFKGDAKFMTVDGILPTSYASSANYWGGYVCGIYAKAHAESCNVTDKPRMENGNFVLNGETGSGAALQVERIDATQGTDIYDAATWQIAIALAASHGIVLPDVASTLIKNVNSRLDSTPARAIGDDFTYGYKTKINNPANAFSYRMLGQHFLSPDPLVGTQYDQYIAFNGAKKDYTKLYGKISWADWKPITGENAWGFFEGPLQADYLLSKINNKNSIPFKAKSVQHAIAVLTAVEAMQSPIGGIYYAPDGSAGNEGPVTPGEISIENNVSLYAGLKMLKQVLSNTQQHASAATQTQIAKQLSRIDTILDGGQLSHGQKTKGLVSFLKNYAWDKSKNEFIASGHYLNHNWQPEKSINAVDVNTWGIAAIGPKTIDQWYGPGKALTAWNNVKNWGSYCNANHCQNGFEGVGFSDQDQHQVFSGEWTFGAINATRVLIGYYSTSHTIGQKELDQLIKDERAMSANVTHLRTDQYSSATVPDAIDHNYQVHLPIHHLAYLYANKRYHIPFGWFANPIPSTASTSWAVMMHYNFNPFILGGHS